MLAACGALALAFRASVTDFSADPAALDALPYDVRTDHVLQLELATEDDLEATLAEREAMGVAPADDAADELYLTSAAVEKPRRLRAGGGHGDVYRERKYVYQAFRCAFTVTGVVRGDDAGDAPGRGRHDRRLRESSDIHARFQPHRQGPAGRRAHGHVWLRGLQRPLPRGTGVFALPGGEGLPRGHAGHRASL